MTEVSRPNRSMRRVSMDPTLPKMPLNDAETMIHSYLRHGLAPGGHGPACASKNPQVYPCFGTGRK